VGTPLYVSPEMLKENCSLPASDLWALGVIIYRMHVGECPFISPTEANVFQKILSLDYSWPQELEVSPEAINIVSHLLRLDPNKRLGAGPPGSSNDLNALLNHPYFEGIDIKNLEVDEVPLIMPSSIVI
jgi:3-phosphoinositide dependent protein kinase-1